MNDATRAEVAPETRLDGFVSYSRRDASAVLPLIEEAERLGRSLWLDADDIPAGTPWREELGNGIEAADSFLACLSDHWLASTECRKEYDQAVDLGKRLVPVVVGDVDTGAVPAPLAVLQWVQARDRDTAEILASVFAAIDVDQERVREHTHWLALALRWERRGQDRSLLVRGQELRSAEDWLGEQGANPAPTPLQTQFVTASRNAERARLRTLLGVALAAVLVTAVLAVVAVVQRGEAVAQRKIAEEQRAEAIRQRDTARSRQLASVALGQIDADPERALLIAKEAWATSPTDEALAALRTTVASSYARATGHAHDESVEGVAWAGDQAVVSIGLDGRLQVSDASDGSSLGEATLAPGRPQYFAATPAGDHGLAMSRSGNVWEWHLDADGRPEQTPALISRDGTAVVASPSDDGLVAVAGDGSATVLADGRSSTVSLLPPRSDETVTEAAAGGGVIAVGTMGGQVYVVRDGAAPELLTTMPSQVASLQLTPDGERLLATAVTGAVVVVDTQTGKVVAEPSAFAFTAGMDATGMLVVTTDINGVVTLTGGPEDLVLSPGGGFYVATDFSDDGSLVAAASLTSGVTVWRTSDGSEVANLLGSSRNIQEVAFAADGRIATGHADGDVRVWQLPPQPVPITPPDPGLAIGGVDDVALSSDENLLAVARTFVDFFEMPSRTEVDPADCPAPPLGDGCLGGDIILELGDAAAAVAFDGEAGLLAVGSKSGDLDVWEIREGRLVSSAPHAGKYVNDVAFAPDGTWVAQGATNGLHIIEVDSGQVVGGSSGPAVNGVVVLADGTILSADATGRVESWQPDSASGEGVVELKETVFDAAADPAGAKVALGVENAVKLVSLDGEHQVTTLQAGTGIVSTVAFTGDGQFVLAGGQDGEVRAWDAATGQLATRLRGGGGGITALASDRTGATIIAGAQTGTYELGCEVCVPVDELVKLADERVTRELTDDERQRFLGE